MCAEYQYGNTDKGTEVRMNPVVNARRKAAFLTYARNLMPDRVSTIVSILWLLGADYKNIRPPGFTQRDGRTANLHWIFCFVLVADEHLWRTVPINMPFSFEYVLLR